MEKGSLIAFFELVALVTFWWLMIRPALSNVSLFHKNQLVNFLHLKGAVVNVAVAEVLTPVPLNTPFPTWTDVPAATSTFRPTYTLQPTYTLPTGETFYYSFYDPALGPPNCWDWHDGKCHSMMASGLDWKNYYGKALACGAEYPLYTVFRVIHPVEIAGDYPCLDRCPSCTGKRVLDFLDTQQRLTWQYAILAQVIYK